MKHWKTNKEMGSGFRYSKRKHEEFYYNSLDKISKHEHDIIRTMYLIRDWWNRDQLKELKCFLDNEIEDREI